MEYASFVKDLRETSTSCSRYSPDTEYAKEFEQNMQALVINFDIDDEKLSEQCHPFSAPTASQIGLKQPMHGSTTFGRMHNTPLAPEDELNHGAARKRKKTIQFDQRYEGHESISSSESSEGISMRYDSFSSIEDDHAWNQCLYNLPNESEGEMKIENKRKLHHNDSLLCQPIDIDEDSLLDSSVYLTIQERDLPIEPSPVLSVSMKRTYDEANS